MLNSLFTLLGITKNIFIMSKLRNKMLTKSVIWQLDSKL
jgi:hypothetical protein